MDRWFFSGPAHGAAVRGLCRIGRHAVGHRSVRGFVARRGGRHVGWFDASVHRPLRPNLRADQCLIGGHGPNRHRTLCTTGHLVGFDCGRFAIADGRTALRVAGQPH